MTPEESARPSRPFPDPEHSITPRKPRTVGGAVYLLVLAGTLAALLMVVVGPWRTGLAVMGGALVVGALGRLVIPDASAGMLGARSKTVDVVTLLGLGAALWLLAAAIKGGPL